MANESGNIETKPHVVVHPALRSGLIISVATALVALLGFLYLKSQGVDYRLQSEILGYLRELKEIDNRWDTEVLRARSQDVVGDIRLLRERDARVPDLQRRLRQAAGAISSPALASGLPALTQAFDQKFELLEKYRAANGEISRLLQILSRSDSEVAGLVRGASKGEGLGNQFLGNIREVDAIVHVLRCFENNDITHVDGRVDPIADAETVETELMLADIESLERRVPAFQKKATTGDKEAKAAASVLGQAFDLLKDGKPARLTQPKDEDERRIFEQSQLLTAKPVLYVCNVSEGDAAAGNALSARVAEKAKAEGAGHVVISAAIEAEISQMDPADRPEFLADLGLAETGLARVIRAGYELLHLVTFFTVGPKEARAWTVETGATAPQAAAQVPPTRASSLLSAKSTGLPAPRHSIRAVAASRARQPCACKDRKRSAPGSSAAGT